MDRAGPRCVTCPLVGLQDVVVDVAQEGCVEPVGHLSQADVEADLDYLLDRELLRQGLVGSVVDAQHFRRSLCIANDRRLGFAVYPVGQGVVTQVPQLLLADPDAPTEHHVMRDSVVAAVCNGRRSVGEFGECWRQTVVIAHGPHEVYEGIGLLGMVGEQPDSVKHLPEARPPASGTPVPRAVSLHRLPALSEFEPSSAPSESCGQRATPKPILNRSEKSGESLATSQLVQHYRQRARGSRVTIVGHFHLALTGEAGSITRPCSDKSQNSRYLRRGSDFMYSTTSPCSWAVRPRLKQVS